MTNMIPASELPAQLVGKGFEAVHLLPSSTYKDCSTIVICPTRGTVHWKVIQSWQSLIAPMNQKKVMLFCTGGEVGKAYNEMIVWILNHPEFSKWKYIMTVEDDNIQPPDAHIKLLESIDAGPFDAVSGLYFTKGDVSMPLALGNPNEFRATGRLDFKAQNVVEGLQRGAVMEVNGIPMGCSLYRMDLFRYVPPPWFVTLNEYGEGGSRCYTQDLSFCERAKKLGKRFALDLRVKVGHLDVNTEVVY
jgi:hypothetical protein